MALTFPEKKVVNRAYNDPTLPVALTDSFDDFIAGIPGLKQVFHPDTRHQVTALTWREPKYVEEVTYDGTPGGTGTEINSKPTVEITTAGFHYPATYSGEDLTLGTNLATVFMAIKPTTLQNNKSLFGMTSTNGIRLVTNSSDFTLKGYIGGSVGDATSTALVDDTEYIIAMTVSSAGTLKIWINNSATANSTTTGMTVPASLGEVHWFGNDNADAGAASGNPKLHAGVCFASNIDLSASAYSTVWANIWSQYSTKYGIAVTT